MTNMKYLRKFNESITSELKGFCDMGLSYLVDEGYVVGLIKNDKKYFNKKEFYYRISLRKDQEYYKTKASKEFYWKDVKDEFIPFFQSINNTYKIDGLDISKDSDDKVLRLFKRYHEDYKEFTYTDVINDEVNLRGKIIEIVFHIKA